VRTPNERKIERISFKPRNISKSQDQPKDTEKEMLYGSVIWFKPKRRQVKGVNGNNIKVQDVIELRSDSRHNLYRQNKSLDDEAKGKDLDNPAPNTKRKNKSIEQNRSSNRDSSIVTKPNTKANDTDTPVKNAKRVGGRRDGKLKNRRNRNRSQNRRKGQGQNRRTNKQRVQNRRGNTNNAKKTKQNDGHDATDEEVTGREEGNPKTGVSQNNSETENKIENVKESVRSTPPKLIDEEIIDDNINRKEPTHKSKDQDTDIITEVKDKIAKRIEDKVVQKIKESQKDEPSITIPTTAKPVATTKKVDEPKQVDQENKEKVVQNADLLGLLLAKSDPGLVKVLLDNSSPENLNVFLNNSNISVDELKDIIAY